jgi:hypothetical protein
MGIEIKKTKIRTYTFAAHDAPGASCACLSRTLMKHPVRSTQCCQLVGNFPFRGENLREN